MTDYCTVIQAKDMLAGQWAPGDQQTGTGSSRDSVLATLVTRCSRMFDRETGKSTNYWAAGTGVTRRYSGDGTVWLDIDDYQTITTITMSSNQTRSDAVTLTATDTTSTNFVESYPLAGPPFTRLFLLRGWLPDAYNVGNIAVTGDVVTPEEITHAVAEWAAYMYKAREVGWADAANRPDGPGLLYVKGIPPDTKRIIEYYKREQRGTGIALIDSGKSDRVSPWLGWRT